MTRERYDELVAEGRELTLQEGQIQWRLGDMALEIEPITVPGGLPGEEHRVRKNMAMFAQDIDQPVPTVLAYRVTSGKWPSERRRPEVPWSIHRILGRLDESRFEVVQHPPMHPTRPGVCRWTDESAKRLVGWRVHTPRSVQEKVEAVHDLVGDEQVAAQVATDLLRRPAVAAAAAKDETACHLFNQAQRRGPRVAEPEPDTPQAEPDVPDVIAPAAPAEPAADWDEVPVQQVEDEPEELERPPSPVAPVVRKIQHTIEFLDLVGACHKFVAAIGRLVPSLGRRRLSEAEIETIHHNLARVRGVLTELRPMFPQVSDLLRGVALADA
ncbi:DUF6192 family protein [Streptomyces violascens]|uniref:DUF6192 family protein n=1 Tax=Streptomyces violascens TaxID=67381 RepID=UPI00367E8ED5